MNEPADVTAPSNRRQFCTALAAATSGAVFARHLQGEDNPLPQPQAAKVHTAVAGQQPSAETALASLLAGNKRFAKGESQHPHESRGWRQALEESQHPFACILGCADSRVCPELIFDQGFGDLFVVRVAGNVVDLDVTASIEYAVDHLQTPLVLVLGHTHCGAVTATLDHLADSQKEPEEIVSLLYRIEPAVADVPAELPRERRIDLGVRKNVEFAVRRLTEVPDLRRSWKAGKVMIAGAVYNMHTGRVEMIEAT